ncbi:hypothetical protein [Holophaga foetida]|uniref:hypothetical protein n=1 Tax=Holophaga foetida TaxID=35839 RepID=UPI0002475057|nr:hypothetical protein [Holophaga foetida]
MLTPLNRCQGPRCTQTGGIAILTVFALLVLATVVSFGLSKNALRELAVTGTVWQAAKASEAAEAGTDWFMLWSNKDNWANATGQKRDVFVQALQQLNATNTWRDSTYLYQGFDTGAAGSGRWDRAVQVVSAETDTDSDMVFVNAGTGFKQSTTVKQSFDLLFRYLGQPMEATVSSASGNPSGGTTAKKGTSLNLYQLQSTGKASVDTGGSYVRYQARREVYATVAP